MSYLFLVTRTRWKTDYTPPLNMQAPLTHLPLSSYDGGGPIEHSGLIKVSGFLSPPYQQGSIAWHLLRNSHLEINAISCAHKGGEKI